MDNVYNLSRTAEAIQHLKVDIVGLQEVDNNTDRHPHDNQVSQRDPVITLIDLNVILMVIW
jgi:endonuclease/exonuclease/phosphatase family metal-dependent hydrolase